VLERVAVCCSLLQRDLRGDGGVSLFVCEELGLLCV